MDLSTKVRIIIAIIAFIIISIILCLSNLSKVKKITKKTKKKNKNKDVRYIEVQYLSVKYKIAKERLYNNKFAIIFAIINSLIICSTFLIIELIPWHFAFQILVGFVLLMAFIYSVYGIIGLILVKRGYQNEL